jgi:hypothetical protein
LEDRWVPSSSAIQSGATLTITANNAGTNFVRVDDLDGKGDVQVSFDGTSFQSFHGITAVAIQASGTTDNVVYNLLGGLTENESVLVNLDSSVWGRFTANLGLPGGDTISANWTGRVFGGKGKDTVNLNVNDNVSGVVQFLAEGGSGGLSGNVFVNDTVSGTLVTNYIGAGTVSMTADCNIASGGTLQMTVMGSGTGNDNLSSTYSGTDNGTLSVFINGLGLGNTLTSEVVEDPSSTGIVSARVNGGPGFNTAIRSPIPAPIVASTHSADGPVVQADDTSNSVDQISRYQQQFADHLNSIWQAQQQREDQTNSLLQAEQDREDRINGLWQAEQDREDRINSILQAQQTQQDLQDHLDSIWQAQQDLQDHLDSIWQAQQQRDDYLNSLWQAQQDQQQRADFLNSLGQNA